MERITEWKTCITLLVIAISYSPALKAGFVFDDESAIVRNADLRPEETSWLSLFINDFWGSPIISDTSHKSYRPLTVLTFRLNYIIHGLHPFGYHAVNVFLHILATWQFDKLAQLFLGEIWSWAATLIFATHPVHVEAVTSVVGRAELLCAIVFFITIRLFHNRHFYLFSIMSFIALLCKEQGITVLAVCIVQLACSPDVVGKVLQIVQRLNQYQNKSNNNSISKLRNKNKFANVIKSEASKEKNNWLNCESSMSLFILLGSISIALCIFRWWIMGGQLPVFTKFDNPASAASWPVRHLTYNYLLPLNMWILILPNSLCADWTMRSIPLITGFSDIRNLITLAFYVLFALFTLKCIIEYLKGNAILEFGEKKASPACCLLFSWSLLVFPFLPASNLLSPVGFVLAERVLYLPSAGYCLLLTFGLKLLAQRGFRKFVIVFFFCLVMAFTIKSASRSTEWYDELSLFTSGIRVNPLNAKLHNNLGHYHEKYSRWSKALIHFQDAQKLQPDDLGSSINVARTLINLGRTQEAEQALMKLKPVVTTYAKENGRRLDPNYLTLWMHLGNLLAKNASRLVEAEFVYAELITMRPSFVDAYINLGDVLIRQNRLSEAIRVYEKALEFPSKRVADLLYNLAVVKSMLYERNPSSPDQWRSVADLFLRSLHVKPNNKEALLNLAILVQRHSLVEYQVELKKFMENYSGEDEERVWFNLALLHTDMGENRTAEALLRKVITQKPLFTSALFNLAIMLVEQQRLVEAEQYLLKLVAEQPNHARALSMLGDLYVQLKQLSDARRYYEQAVNVLRNTSHASNGPLPTAEHNLCVVLRMQGNVEEADKCFARIRKHYVKRKS